MSSMNKTNKRVYIWMVLLLSLMITACGSDNTSDSESTIESVNEEKTAQDAEEEETENEEVLDAEVIITNKAEELGDVEGLTIEDYDGDGDKEAFGVVVFGEEYSGCRRIQNICYIDSEGNVKEFAIDSEDDAPYYYADPGNTYYDVYGHGFYHGEYGFMGSGSVSFLYGVKEGEPYELSVSRKMEKLDKSGDKFMFLRPVELPPDSENVGNYKAEIELMYSKNSGEFKIGEPTGKIVLNGEDVTDEYNALFGERSLDELFNDFKGEWIIDYGSGACIGVASAKERGDLLYDDVASKAKWVVWLTMGDVLTDLDVYEYDEKQIKFKTHNSFAGWDTYYIIRKVDDRHIEYYYGTNDGSYGEPIIGTLD